MTENTLSTILGLSALSDRYRGVLCDVWGVVHNGVAAFEPACTALARFREAGGSVVLLTNAPRPSGPIYEQLDDLGVPRAAYDTIVTSGDATRAYLLEKGIAKVLHIGPERDLSFFEGTDIERVGADTAELVICTGLFDDTTETPADYADQLAELKAHGLSFVCANPDIVVERGSELVWCAGGRSAPSKASRASRCRMARSWPLATALPPTSPGRWRRACRPCSSAPAFTPLISGPPTIRISG